MVQDPRDLLRGHPGMQADRKTGAAAVDRLWQDKVTPLPGGAQPPANAPDTPPPAPGAH